MGASGDTVSQQVSDALRHDLGLAGSGRRDDLQVAAAVANRGKCGTLKPRSTHDGHLPGLDAWLAARPLDRPAANVANGQLRVVIGQRTADEIVGKHMGVAMAAAAAGDEPVDRVKVTA
jgi:hypothetical protein